MNFDIVKTILDFLAKCLYPAIAVVLIYLFYPKIQEIDLQTLSRRLHSAKVGDSEFTFSEAEKVGAETAPLNRKVAELELNVADIKSVLEKNSSLNKEKPIEVQEQLKLFKANASYTTLVFHDLSSRKASEKITQLLLRDGYTASDTETDFAELQKVQRKDETIFITYTKSGEQILDEIKSKIMKLGVAKEVSVNPRPIELKRGDIQIYVF